MREVMYNIPTYQIALILFLSMALIIELGYRFGRWAQHNATEPAKSHTGAIQGSMLGILALLLGFTFSLSLNRHDNRSEAVVFEANAIGTAWLRTELLPVPDRAQAQLLLREYINLRASTSGVNLAEGARRQELLRRTATVQGQIWSVAAAAGIAQPNPVTTGLYISSVNDMIDAFGTRDAALARHVPEMVLFLLYGTFLMTGCVMGFTAGLSGHRTSFVTYIMIGLIVVLVFIIVDLDRPRRGLIQVNQGSLLQLQASIDEKSGAPAAETR